MDIVYRAPLTQTSYRIMRDAGYIPIHDRKSGKQSYVYKIRGDRYPRFHVYVREETENNLTLHVHLDHKAHGWSETSRHDADYDSADVAQEAERLKRWLAHHTQKTKL